MGKFIFICACSLVALFFSSCCLAQDVSTLTELANSRIRDSALLAPLDGSFVGERVGLATGALDVVQVDIDIPGNNGLPVRLARRFYPGRFRQTKFFAEWELDIPRVYGTFARAVVREGWVTDRNGEDAYKRCSFFGAPPVLTHQGMWWNPDEYWSGSYLYMPGQGEKELLGASVLAHTPVDGRSYPVVTTNLDAIRCVPLASTSEAGSRGEGFEVISPDGVVHTLNHLVSRAVTVVRKSGLESMLDVNGGSMPAVSNGYIIGRQEVSIYPTRVADRFGNYVDYRWSQDNPWQLESIVSSDGRRIDFTYDQMSGYIVSATDGERVWGYRSVDDKPGYPVVYPDGRRASDELYVLSRAKPTPTQLGCDSINVGSSSYTGSITAYTGIKVEFTLSDVKFGRSWVPYMCNRTLDGGEYAEEAGFYAALVLTKRRVTGPGLPADGLTWLYDYGPANDCWLPGTYNDGRANAVCTSNSPTTRSVTVTAPDGTLNRSTFSNKFMDDEGLLVREEYGLDGASVLRTRAIEYADVEASPYFEYNGISYRNYGNFDTTGMFRPVRRTTIGEGRLRYINTVGADCPGLQYCYDSKARPLKILKFTEGMNGVAEGGL